MTSRRTFFDLIRWALALVLLLPAASYAQSAIGGVVKDATGGVLPGVTVEASSPSLIEKTRSVVTDDQGLYKIVDLRPGVYSVTFSLSGFNTVKREGLELPDAFTATVNGELRVGSVEETITVTGQAPVVDVQNVAQRAVLSNTLTDALPSSRLVQNYVTYVPGTTGTTLGVVGLDTRSIQIHGGRTGEFIITVDGFSTDFMSGFTGVSSSFFLNQAIVQETNVQSAGAMAEQQFGGVMSNVIPKEGSNAFSGYFFGSYSNGSMQSNNLDDQLKAQGLPAVNHNLKLFDVDPAAGGRIMKDKLWFYAAGRTSLIDRRRAGVYYNLTPLGWAYTPDLTRPAHSAIRDYDYSLRLTLQATPKNKFMLFFDQQPHYVDQRNSDGNQPATFAPEATNYTAYWPNTFYNAIWKSPISNRLLLEAGANAYVMGINTRPSRDPGYAVDPFTIIAARDLTNNICFRASCPQLNLGWTTPANRSASGRASASYITGSHAIKGGMQFLYGQTASQFASNDIAVDLRANAAGVLTPVTLFQFIKPQDNQRNALELGLYAQDQWTMKRATINYGLRFDRQRGTVPANDLAAGAFVPAREYPAVNNVPLYKDVSPRLGVSYDLFGDGKTAVKGTVNRYVVSGGNGIAAAMDPLGLSVLSVSRSWTDTNGNFFPDCNLSNPLAQANAGGDVCGQVSDLNFGQINPKNLGYNQNLLSGWGVRPYAWEISGQVQREINSNASVNFGYFRRWYGNFTTTDNLLVSSSDYSSYCVTAPVNPALPSDVSGSQICGLYDIVPSKGSLIQNQINAADTYGTRTENWNGVDITVNIRLPKGATLNGGLSSGRSHTVDCGVIDSPGGNTINSGIATANGNYQQQRFCDTLQPFQTQVKFLGRYPLPWWGLELSGVLQNIPGPALTATAVYSAAQTTLGRAFGAGGSTVTIGLIQPNTVYLDRQTQVDLRLAKSFKVGRARLTGSVDLNNVNNGNGIQRFNDRVSSTSTWPTPQDIQPARNAAVNAQLTF